MGGGSDEPIICDGASEFVKQPLYRVFLTRPANFSAQKFAVFPVYLPIPYPGAAHTMDFRSVFQNRVEKHGT
jgi:hypothetical protein